MQDQVYDSCHFPAENPIHLHRSIWKQYHPEFLAFGTAHVSFVHNQKDTAAKWVIGKVEAEPGETVKVPVSVEGDKDGLNSYLVKITQDAGPKAVGATAGSAYSELSFQANKDNLTFGGTNSDQKKNIVAADGDVFYMEFEVPSNAEPGTKYNLKFADIDLEDIDMNQA